MDKKDYVFISACKNREEAEIKKEYLEQTFTMCKDYGVEIRTSEQMDDFTAKLYKGNEAFLTLPACCRQWSTQKITSGLTDFCSGWNAAVKKKATFFI